MSISTTPRIMLDEHMTPRCFWADAISTACYISNRIFLCSILNLTPFELHFGCKPSISHLRPFGCKCFVVKHGNLDKFESPSSGGILLRYSPHGRSYRLFNHETNNVVESCDVTFDKTAPCPRDVFECDKDEPLLPSTSSPELVPTSTLKAEAPQATTSSIAVVEASWIKGEIIFEQGSLSHIQKAHPPQ
jgi:hypothetical protein